MSSRAPARRAVLRWAWRLFRREWRQQALVLALLTVAVAAAVAGATMTVNGASKNHGFGNADAMARLDGLSPADAAQRVANIRARVGNVEVISHELVAVPGSIRHVDLRGEDPRGAFGRPLLSLRDGRYPTSPAEVALTRGVADLLGASIGDDVRLGRGTRHVVGVVENPSQLKDEFALLAPDAGSTDSLQLLFDLPNGGRDGGIGLGGVGVMVAGDDGPVAVLVLVAVTLGMALVGLIAAAGFVVVAARRQRQLGLLAALGATERDRSLVMVANGAIVGTVAALAGAAVGLGAWFLAAPAIEHVANHRISRLDLPWPLLGACVVLAIVAGTAAAWWPARRASRVPVMRALSGRPTRPAPVHRSVLAAALLLGGGMAAIAIALPRGHQARAWLLIAGMISVIVGAVFAAPAAIRAAAAPAARLPLAPRVAVRDLARHQSRASAALAAMTLGLAVSVALIGLAQASEHGDDAGNVSDRQLLLRIGDSPMPDTPTASDLAALDAKAATVAAAIGHPAVLTLEVPMTAVPVDGGSRHEAVGEAKPLGVGSYRFVSQPYIATPELLDLLHIHPADVSSSTDLLSPDAGSTVLLDTGDRSRATPTTPSQRIDVPRYSSAPRSLVTEAAMQRHGWKRTRAGWLLQSPSTLTRAQVSAAQAAAASVGLAVESRDHQDALAAIRVASTLAGALLALAIVAMTLGLLRSESTRDLQTLTATGASSHVRRMITASTAAVLAALGVLLGTAGAYAALAAGYHSQLSALVPVPLTELATLAVGLPVAAAGIGWLLAGAEPRAFARRALE